MAILIWNVSTDSAHPLKMQSGKTIITERSNGDHLQFPTQWPVPLQPHLPSFTACWHNLPLRAFAQCPKNVIVASKPLCVSLHGLKGFTHGCDSLFPGIARSKTLPRYRQCRRCKKQGFNPWVKILGGGHGNLMQYSCLEHSMHRGVS